MLGVCGCLRGQGSSGVGVLGSVMSSLASHWAFPQLLDGLINLTVLAWLCFVYPWLCVILLVPLFLGESCLAREWQRC